MKWQRARAVGETGLLLVVWCLLLALWGWRGGQEMYTNADLARDLHMMSNLWLGRIVWLGPQLRVNFPVSPFYYYVQLPFLWITGGSGYSLVWAHVAIAICPFLLLAVAQPRSRRWLVWLLTLGIGLAPWWINASAHPWNGHMYLSWVLLALVSLWREWPLPLSALWLGCAIAIHPAAILVAPVMVYEWARRPAHGRNGVLSLVAMLAPWAPIIVFEIITKGFLVRQWWLHPNAGMTWLPGLANWRQLSAYFSFPWWVGAGLYVVTGWRAEPRWRWWLVLLLIPLTFLFLISPLLEYYLLGLVCVLAFVAIVVWAPARWGRWLIVLYILFNLGQLGRTPLAPEGRSVRYLSQVVTQTMAAFSLPRTARYAVLNVRDRVNSTPQADDYRFLLRTKGYNALDINEYSAADILLLFVEVPDFSWQTYDDWHVQQFGARQLVGTEQIKHVRVVVYKRMLPD